MRLTEVLPADIAPPPGADAVHVTGITAASAAVGPGAIFAGIPGSKIDGTAFVADAVARGAAAVVVARGKGVAVPAGVVLIEVENPRAALAKIAAKFAQRQPRCAVAVTGTSGKTSVADFTRQIFSALGHNAASIGTIGIVKPGGAIYGSLTTPDPVTLHAMLAELVDEGVTHLAFEASSHGLDQHRLDGVVALGGGLHESRPRSHGLSSERRRLSEGEAPPFCRAARARSAGGHQYRWRRGRAMSLPRARSAGSGC